MMPAVPSRPAVKRTGGKWTSPSFILPVLSFTLPVNDQPLPCRGRPQRRAEVVACTRECQAGHALPTLLGGVALAILRAPSERYRDAVCLPVGRSQVVRQRILIPPFPGSNPGAPANAFKRLALQTLVHLLGGGSATPRPALDRLNSRRQAEETCAPYRAAARVTSTATESQ